MVHMPHILVQMHVVRVTVGHVNVQVHVHRLVVQLEQQRQTQEIIMIHTVVQMIVANPRVGIVIVVFVLHPLVEIVGIVIQI